MCRDYALDDYNSRLVGHGSVTDQAEEIAIE